MRITKTTFVAMLISAVALVSCNSGKAEDPLADTGRTQRTENLLESMKRLADTTGYMFGHQDDTAYGIGWVGDSARSDVKSVCGDYPAVIGFDLGHIELGDSCNLDGVPFDRIRQEIISQYDRGGVIALSWHLDNPLSKGTSWVADSLRDIETKTVESVLPGGKESRRFEAWLNVVCDFFNSLETPYGVKVPVIFRPWHEHTGSWFWWGKDHCSAAQYKQLWQITVDRLKEKKVTNVLLAYSPGTECDGDAAKYLERYPGDDIIDILGLDTYCFAQNEEDTVSVSHYAEKLEKNLTMLCKIAKEHSKVAALTETGFEGLPFEHWWTETLMPVLNQHPISYVLVWRNAHDKVGHYYAPFPGQKTVSDFVHFYNDPKTLFAHDVNALYLKKEVEGK